MRGTLRIACADSDAAARRQAGRQGARTMTLALLRESSQASLNLFCSSVSVPPVFSTGTISTRGSSSSVSVASTFSPPRRTKRIGTRSPGLWRAEHLVVVSLDVSVGAVETHELIVLRDAGLVERRVQRHQPPRAARCRRRCNCAWPANGLPAARLRSDQARAREQLRVVHQLAAFDKSLKKSFANAAIAGDLGQRVLQAVDRVGRGHHAGLLLTRPAELRPQRAHVVDRRSPCRSSDRASDRSSPRPIAGP